MNLENLAYIGEFVAAIGVVASLVYLSIQIKRSESTTRAATTQELLSKSIDMLLWHDENSPMLKHAIGEPLSQKDRKRLELAMFALFSHFNNAHHQNAAGKLDPEIWDMYDARTRRNVKQMNDFDQWWSQYKINFTGSFCDYIEQIK
ncbi:hypothetical protein N9060_00245 [Arenicella sp.]|nr:hypothetical protein [Arenicella sp.]